MASDEASVDHPLCRECAAALRKQLEKQARLRYLRRLRCMLTCCVAGPQIAQSEHDCAAYEELLVELQEEQAAAAPADEFEREMQQVRLRFTYDVRRLAALSLVWLRSLMQRRRRRRLRCLATRRRFARRRRS
jgi:hypothetical protein